MRNRPLLPGLTSLRFFAALGVVLYHFAAGASHSWPPFLANVVHNGSAGVPFFFILSGFVLAYTYFEVETKPVRFWWLRFARIYPTYALSLLIAFPPYLIDLRQAGRASELGVDGIVRVLMLQMWVPGESLQWNGPAWSLSCEAFFYLLFPLLLPLLAARVRLELALGVVMTVGYAFFNRGAEMLGGDGPAYLASTPIKYALLFAAGICFALAFLRGFRTASWVFALASVGCIGILGSTPDLSSPSLGLALCLGFGLMILSGASLERGKLAMAFAWPPLVVLGEASYSLYILHEPLGSYLHFIVKKLGTTMDEWWFLTTSVFLVVGVSVLCYRWFEMPANRWLRAKFR